MPSGGARPGAGCKKKNAGDSSGYERTSFTDKQLQELLASPHVSFVSRTTVSYTLEFKKLFWQRYVDGIDPMQIFADAGINPTIVGRNRIKGLADLLRGQKSRGIPFSDGKEEPKLDLPDKLFELPPPPRRPRYTEPDYTPNDVAKLIHQVKYLSQELEFLKKNYLSGQGRKVDMMMKASPSVKYEIIRNDLTGRQPA